MPRSFALRALSARLASADAIFPCFREAPRRFPQAHSTLPRCAPRGPSLSARRNINAIARPRQGSLSGGETADSSTYDASATHPRSRPLEPRPAQWLRALLPALLAPARARSARGRAGGMDAFGRAVSAMAQTPRAGTAPPHRLVFASCWASRGSARARGACPRGWHGRPRGACPRARGACPRGKHGRPFDSPLEVRAGASARVACAASVRPLMPLTWRSHSRALAFLAASPHCRGKLCGRVLPVIPKLSRRSTAALSQTHIQRIGSDSYQMPA